MTRWIMIAAATLAASPAVAQEPAPADPFEVRLPPELTDPATADKLATVMQALSSALLDLPVGGIEAAVLGREPTAADRKRTVRDLGRRDDPNFERNLEQQMALAKPMMQASMKAMATALPAMMKGLSEAARELEKATANLPSPAYPRQ